MKKFVLFIFMLAVFISCKKDDDHPSDEPSILTKANIEGSVKLFDEWGNPLPKDRMLITMNNGSNNYWAETEKDGSFLFLNVLYARNYTISYSKSGFGTYKIFGFHHEYTGEVGKIPSTPVLGMISSTYVKTLEAIPSDTAVVFNVSISSTKEVKGNRRIRFIFHTIPEISNEVFSNFSNKFQLANSYASLTLAKDDLLEMGLESGTKYWVQAYGESYYSNAYEDDAIGRYVLPNLGYKSDEAVPTVTFTMP